MNIKRIGSTEAKSEECVLITKIFSDISLMKDDDSCWIQFPRVYRRPRSDPETQWDVAHTVDNNTLVLRCVLCDATKMCLHDVVSVQEGHFTVRFYPDLVLGVPCDIVKGRDVQLELAAFAELAKAGSDTDQVGSCDGETETHGGFRDIEHPVLVQTETVWLVWSVNEMNEILSDVVRQFGEQHFRFIFSEWAHGCGERGER